MNFPPISLMGWPPNQPFLLRANPRLCEIQYLFYSVQLRCGDNSVTDPPSFRAESSSNSESIGKYSRELQIRSIRPYGHIPIGCGRTRLDSTCAVKVRKASVSLNSLSRGVRYELLIRFPCVAKLNSTLAAPVRRTTATLAVERVAHPVEPIFAILVRIDEI